MQHLVFVLLQDSYSTITAIGCGLDKWAVLEASGTIIKQSMGEEGDPTCIAALGLIHSSVYWIYFIVFKWFIQKCECGLRVGLHKRAIIGSPVATRVSARNGGTFCPISINIKKANGHSRF